MKKRARATIVIASALVAVALLAAPASVLGRSATLVAAKGDSATNHPIYTWTLPPGVQSEFVETATSNEVGVGGHFLQKKLKSFSVVGANDTTFKDEYEFDQGTYYVHVGTHDTVRTQDTPLIEFSNVLCFRVLSGPRIASCPAPPGGNTGDGGVNDKTAPRTSLKFRRVQDIDKLRIKVQPSENATIRVTGTVSVRNASRVYRFKRKTLVLPGNASSTVRLRLAKKKLRAVKRALRGKRRLKARIRVVATDTAGNRGARKATIRLKN